ncbi:MAG TPA: DUF3500 domain-containing protein [Streptosporangiaceae bacterium]|nr:DUF3500 domain-containing protein [Streptosporangiaceae bacterium]
MASVSVPAQMRSAAGILLRELDDGQRAQAAFPLADDAARRWIEYRPEYRPGACLAQLSTAARKAAHRLLSTALSDHAYAQAMAIVALEEVLDRAEGWRNGRFSGDYYVSVFGDPSAGDAWSWRFEGHHLSVTMTLRGDKVSPAPIFLGANPAHVRRGGRTVSAPLAPEEDLAWELLAALDSPARDCAVVAENAPHDIRSATKPRADPVIAPRGVEASRLAPGARALLDQLVMLYLDRLPAELAAAQAARIAGGEMYFAWEGPVLRGARHYYRLQADDLLIEYDNTAADGNHVHSVLRRPRSDFGADILAEHYDRDHQPVS